MIELGGGVVKKFDEKLLQTTDDLVAEAASMTHIFADELTLIVETLIKKGVTCLRPTFIADKILLARSDANPYFIMLAVRLYFFKQCNVFTHRKANRTKRSTSYHSSC